MLTSYNWVSTIYTESENSYLVWKMDGSVNYIEGGHKYLFIFAVLVAVGTLPYTLSLLFIQCNKRLNLKILFWVVKLKPFFDAHTGPFKVRYHFWTGFLLVVRIILFSLIAIIIIIILKTLP